MTNKVTGALATVLLGAGLIAGIGAVVQLAKPDATFMVPTEAGTLETERGVVKHYTMELSAYPDSLWNKDASQPGWVSYGPKTNFKLPANSAITVTINQYDSGEPLNNDFFAHVRGTIDGSMLLNGKRVTDVDPNTVGHTFTVRALANGTKDNFFLNIPLPAVPDDKMSENEGEYINPQVVTFTFLTPASGEYVWNCEFPCGDGSLARFGAAMSTQGYMSGHIMVEEGA